MDRPQPRYLHPIDAPRKPSGLYCCAMHISNEQADQLHLIDSVVAVDRVKFGFDVCRRRVVTGRNNRKPPQHSLGLQGRAAPCDG